MREIQINDLIKRKEFIYKLNDKYYHIGYGVCRVIDNEEWIKDYEDYLIKYELCDFPLYEYHYQEVYKEKRDNLAIAFDKILQECHMPCEFHPVMELEQFISELDETGKQSIIEQMKRQNMADNCFLLMKIERER